MKTVTSDKVVIQVSNTSELLDNIDNTTFESLPEDVKTALNSASQLCNIIESEVADELDY